MKMYSIQFIVGGIVMANIYLHRFWWVSNSVLFSTILTTFKLHCVYTHPFFIILFKFCIKIKIKINQYKFQNKKGKKKRPNTMIRRPRREEKKNTISMKRGQHSL